MPELIDIANDFIRQEIDEFIERPDERQRLIDLFARVRPEMAAISAALIDGDHHTVDALTRAALDAVGLVLLEDHVNACLRDGISRGHSDDKIAQLVTTVRHFVRSR